MLVLDADLRVVSANPAFYKLFPFSRQDMVGYLIFDLGSQQWDISALRKILDEILSESQPFEDVLIEHQFRGIGHLTMLLTGRKLSREGERADLILLAIADITERKRAQEERRKADEHRELLIGELNHRVKNTLAIVQSIATQTLAGDALSIEAARTAFMARLMALSKAHDLLAQGSWEATDLASVVSAATKTFVHERNTFRIEGSLLQLAPDRAVSITMALHELATNAAKFGALSVEDGHVDVVWRLTGEGEDRRLHFRWAESGGPPVRPPERRGFGSRMIERVLAQELDGTVTMTYEPSGVVCILEAPMPLLREETGQNGMR